MKAKRAQRPGRSKERSYSPEDLKALVISAEKAAIQGTQRMQEREKAYLRKE